VAEERRKRKQRGNGRYEAKIYEKAWRVEETGKKASEEMK
jgi:hypothetical protein